MIGGTGPTLGRTQPPTRGGSTGRCGRPQLAAAVEEDGVVEPAVEVPEVDESDPEAAVDPEDAPSPALVDPLEAPGSEDVDPERLSVR